MIEWMSEALSKLVASISVDNPAGLAAIFFFTALADVGFPFPFLLDTILFYTAYQEGPLSWPVFLIVIMMLGGRILGTGIIYWLSRLVGAKFINWISRLPQFPRRNFEQFKSRLGRWCIPAIAIARLTPGLMQVSSVTAGSLHIRFYQVVLAIALSSIIYDGALIILGYLAAIGFKGLDPKHTIWIVVGFLTFMVIVFVVVLFIKRTLKHS